MTKAINIIRQNKWARIKSYQRGAYYLVEAKGPHGWIAQSDFVSRNKAIGIYKRLSDRTGFHRLSKGR